MLCGMRRYSINGRTDLDTDSDQPHPTIIILIKNNYLFVIFDIEASYLRVSRNVAYLDQQINKLEKLGILEMAWITR